MEIQRKFLCEWVDLYSIRLPVLCYDNRIYFRILAAKNTQIPSQCVCSILYFLFVV